MSRQWLRKIILLVSSATGPALDLSQFHVIFDVRNATTQTLKRLNVRIYNLDPYTVNQLRDEFTTVALMAGYEKNIA